MMNGKKLMNNQIGGVRWRSADDEILGLKAIAEPNVA